MYVSDSDIGKLDSNKEDNVKERWRTVFRIAVVIAAAVAAGLASFAFLSRIQALEWQGISETHTDAVPLSIFVAILTALATVLFFDLRQARKFENVALDRSQQENA